MDLSMSHVVTVLLSYVTNAVILLIALATIPANRRPSSSSAWILLILAFPLLGWLLFALFGRTNLEERRHQRQGEANDVLRRATAPLPYLLSSYQGPEFLAGVGRLNRSLGHLPAVDGNDLELFPGYEAAIDAMAATVRGATRTVNVQFYISAWDDVTAPFFEAMADAVQRGVTVRFLFDHLGSRGIPGYAELKKRLDAAGIRWVPMLPVAPFRQRFRRPDLRNHRKILVVDGTVAFSGSQNLIEPGYDKPKNHRAGRHWVELVARIEGPAVAALNAVFASDWYTETGEDLSAEVRGAEQVARPDGCIVQVVPSGPGFPAENNLRLFTSLVYGARERLSITSPYFVPDESLLYAVTTAALRGVAVELFVNEQADQLMVHHAQSSYYEALLRAGVRIFQYPAPAVLHSKHMSVDDDVAVLGSSNMDMRSFALNYEVTMMLVGREVVSRMRAVEDEYRRVSTELLLPVWLERPRRTRILDNAMRLTSAVQ